ncbi:radical SAM protein [Tumebacillus sp. ITR2]|uniref:Radical SAM protein n=1 Tax=Tumebacillus amylolyticus TaxID=2801339 RepID=A0ABS1J6J8_9BACL|nr:radical SAM protein [Tumebacillus amylolyticus]MBL0385837.1 radical SAM protein [Tumebacillus amylolyticus]
MEPFIKLEQEEKQLVTNRYKASRFNMLATEDDGSLYLSNTMTGSFIAVPAETVPEVKSLLRLGYEGEAEGLVQQLVDRGFMVKEEVNELFRARMLHEIVGRRSDTLQLIFLTSEQCNFRCVYCYEKFEKGNMQPEVREAVKKYVQKQARFLNSLNIHWFGGEPLLALDTIEDLSQEFLRICGEQGIRYHSAMTTNGYLLTPDVATRVLDLGVKTFQITLDSDAEQHDKHRHLAGGQPTFQKIWNNLLELKKLDRQFLCRIRVNFDQANLPNIPNFIETLSEHFGKDPRFSVNFFPIGQWGGPNDDELPVLSEKQAFTQALSLCETAMDKDLNNALENRLKPGGYVCYAARSNSFVIGSDGILYKCTVALYNEKNIVGKLQPDGTMKLNKDNLALWIMNDESEDTGCKTCFFRPACQGASCPLVRIESGKAPCPPEKKNIQKVIRIVGREMKKRYLATNRS